MDTEIIKFFNTCWGIYKPINFFPGPQPISIERKHIKYVKSHDYVVCEKTDGTRASLVCVKFNNQKITCIINRALEINHIVLNIPDEAYMGTIVDGELVGSDFIVYDGICVNGVDIKTDNLVGRLNKIGNFVNEIKYEKESSFIIKLKQFYFFQYMNKFIDDVIPTLTYKIDGFIFTPINECVRIGTHETMFKWKPRDKNTVDFLIKYNKDDYSLFLQEKGKLVFDSDIPRSKLSFDVKDDDIVECQYIQEVDTFDWWKPLHIRTDKKHPNNKRTKINTLKNIEEDIQIHEFLM